MTTKRQTTTDIKEWLLLNGRGFDIVGEYTNSRTKTLFRCPHGHEWSTTSHDIKSGKGCPRCAGHWSWTTEEFRQLLAADSRGIKLIGEYKGSNVKTLFECKHGHQWMAGPASIKNGRTACPTCKSIAERKTTAEFRREIDAADRGIKHIGEYEANHIKTLFECNKGHQWLATPCNVRNGSGCPTCSPNSFNPDKPAWEYVFVRGNYIKFGITNNLKGRLKRHQRNGDLILIHERYHEVGQRARDWENNIKRTYGGHFVTKEQCPDGWTETLPIHLTETISKELIT